MTQEPDIYVPIVSPDTLITVSDAIEAGMGATTAYDAFGPTVPACISVANMSLLLHGLVEEAKLKLFFGLDGVGYGYGYGDSYGYGNGDGNGNGNGDGNNYGDGYGYGEGDGNSYGYGYGDGDGNGYAYGTNGYDDYGSGDALAYGS